MDTHDNQIRVELCRVSKDLAIRSSFDDRRLDRAIRVSGFGNQRVQPVARISVGRFTNAGEIGCGHQWCFAQDRREFHYVQQCEGCVGLLGHIERKHHRFESAL